MNRIRKVIMITNYNKKKHFKLSIKNQEIRMKKKNFFVLLLYLKDSSHEKIMTST